MMMSVRTVSAMIMIIFLMNGDALCRTWYVEKDGNGDFTTIQPALDATAPGDTVIIGPGRYTETEQVVTPGWTEDVHAVVLTDSITIIGAGAGVTTLGPEHPQKDTLPWPKGFFGWDVAGVAISRLTVENVRDCINWEGGLILEQCVLNGGDDGIVAWPYHGIEISDVVCAGNVDHGIIMYGPSPGAQIVSCEFSGNRAGVSIVGIENVWIGQCDFNDHVVGVQYDTAVGELSECVFSDITNVNVVLRLSNVNLINNSLAPSGLVIDSHTFSHLSGSGNVVPGGWYSTMEISGGTADFHGNHILNSGGRSVRLTAFLEDPPYIIDLSGNYWGTTIVDSISSWIWDGHDDPDIHAFVEFEPFSPVPLPSEQKSMGDVKRMFR